MSNFFKESSSRLSWFGYSQRPFRLISTCRNAETSAGTLLWRCTEYDPGFRWPGWRHLRDSQGQLPHFLNAYNKQNGWRNPPNKRHFTDINDDRWRSMTNLWLSRFLSAKDWATGITQSPKLDSTSSIQFQLENSSFCFWLRFFFPRKTASKFKFSLNLHNISYILYITYIIYINFTYITYIIYINFNQVHLHHIHHLYTSFSSKGAQRLHISYKAPTILQRHLHRSSYTGVVTQELLHRSSCAGILTKELL